MLSKIVLLSAFIVVFAGCSTTKVMDRIMSSWQSEHIDKIISQWGYPSEVRELRGNQLYIWVYNKSAFIPQSSTTTGSIYGNTIYTQTNSYGGHAIHGTCIRILEVNKDGYVVSWEWKGNNCPFMEAMEYSKWRNRDKNKEPGE